MTERLRRTRALVVGATLVGAGLLIALAGSDATWTSYDVSTLTLAAGVLAVGFAIAAALLELAGERRRGLANLLAVAGWLALLVGTYVGSDAANAVGVVCVVAAGVYLAWMALD